MPASEEFYRDQKRLNLVFLGSALVLFLVTIWMLAADHYLPWKKYVIEFEGIKREKLANQLAIDQAEMDQSKLADLVKKRDEAKAKQDANSVELNKRVAARDRLQKFEVEIATRNMQSEKANISEKQSEYDLAVGDIAKGAFDGPAAEQRLIRKRDEAKKKLDAMLAKFNQTNLLLEKKNAELAQANKAVDELKSAYDEAQKAIDLMEADIQKLQKAIEATAITAGVKFRDLPIINAFAPLEKPKQIVLKEVPLDVNFALATRFDRCMTCHLGIDQTGFNKSQGISEPLCSHPKMDLYVGAKSKHPSDKFGCTVCHEGQGSATSFDFASHTPANGEQRREWINKYGWFYNHFHKTPMQPKQLGQAACLKCHHDPYQIPEADKLLRGYELVRSNGCFGCHEINGYLDDGTKIGPNLRIAAATDDPKAPYAMESLNKVGPDLTWASQKLTPEFIAKWVRDPQSFRPNSKMPQFYYQMDNHNGFYGSAPSGEFAFGVEADKGYDHDHDLKNLANAEIRAIAHYLTVESQKALAARGLSVPTIAAKGSKEAGKHLFMVKGCLACHNHKDASDVKKAYPQLEEKNFGPDLSEIAAKFTEPKQKAWVVAWIHNPSSMNPKTKMPNLQLTDQESADIAEYLLSVNGHWARDVKVPEAAQLATKTAKGTSDPVRDLLINYERKGSSAEVAVRLVNGMSAEDRLYSLGEKTISRLGCFGCHEIPGKSFERAKPIGVPLNTWGKKDAHQLAFENVREVITEEMEAHAANPAAKEPHFYEKNDYYLWALDHHLRDGFLMQKIRDPRSYDHKKLRRWDDRLRMPRFAKFSDADREAIETFILGLTAEKNLPKFVYKPSPQKQAVDKGHNLLEKYNCTACHVIKPGEYKFTPNDKESLALMDAAKKNLGEDYSEAVIAAHNAWVPPEKTKPADKSFTVRGLPNGEESADEAEDPRDPKKYVRLWYAASLRGETVPSGMQVAIPKSQFTTQNVTDPQGGMFAMMLADYLMKTVDPTDPTKKPFATDRDKGWQKVPPPLIREGEKVQTAWLYNFLKDPQKIRPAVMLRMPKFNYEPGDAEALATFFAAQDNVPYPYFEMSERSTFYLDQKMAKHPNYLEDAFRLVTNKDLCVKCHPIGGIDPKGKPDELGPNLVRAPERLRPEWMMRWITNPKRFVPYTAMPVNFEKAKSQYQSEFKGSNLEQIQAARDVLLNYSKIIDSILTKQQASAQPVPAGNQPPAKTGGGQ